MAHARAAMEFAGHEIPETNIPKRQTIGYWRYSMEFVCMCQVGYALTKAARDGIRGLSLTSDGSPVKGFHVEGVIVKISDTSLSLIPRVCGSKAADETTEAIVVGLDECQIVYNIVYNVTKNPPPELPRPLPEGAFLILFDSTNHDHAPNEGAKAKQLSERKQAKAITLKASWKEV